MALDQANQKPIQRDSAGQPAPQVFNPDTNEYEVAVGTGGRQHTILYTADGNPVDLTTLLGAIQSASEATKAAVEGTLVTQLSGSSGAVDSEAGALAVRTVGLTLAESTQTEADATGGVHTFAGTVAAIEIWKNDPDDTLVAVVNGTTITIPAGAQHFEPTLVDGTPSASVTISGAASYYLNRYR